VPRKALDRDYLGYLTMMICYELGKTEEEVKSWTLDDLFRWLAFFRLKRKAEQKAQQRASKKGPTNPNSKVEVL